ncbi:MAG: amidase [Actinobacteria bacterium]|nr:amidase [Actinomycetota bacterium]
MSDLVDLTIAEAAPMIRERELSPVELTAAYLDRIAERNDAYNAYITVTRERAIADAKRAEAEITAGQYRGALHGVPIGLKDIVSTAGIRTTCGSKILRDWIPDADAHVASKLSAAGSVLLGKLNTHEFAMGATNNNPHFGPARNPWNLAVVSGGSSGGSGVAMAGRLAMAAIGTDTGGSIRIPAALCGCVGLKPTYGLVSRSGVHPLSGMRDHVGPLTRSVEDAALMLQAVAGYDPDDANSLNIGPGNYLATIRDGVAGLRIGVPAGVFAELPTAEVRGAIAAALDVLAGMGATVLPVELDHAADLATIGSVLMPVEAGYYHRAYLPDRISEYGADLQARFGAPEPDRVSISTALAASEAVRVAFQRVLTTVDLLATPTVAFTAPPIGAHEFTVDGRTYSEADIPALTLAANHARTPVLSVPCGFSAANLPIGLSLMGRPFDEARVLRVGYAYEQATDWHRRRPDESSERSIA